MIPRLFWALTFALTFSTLTVQSANAVIAEEVANIKGSICGPAMIGLYELAEKNNRKAVFIERFLSPWVALEKFLQAPLSPEEIALQMKSSDARVKVFQSVEMLKFYRKFFKGTDYEKPVEKFIDRANEFEDKLGFLVDSEKLVKNLEKMQAHPNAIRLAKMRAKKGFDQFVAFLKEGDWLGPKSKTLKDMVKLFKTMDHPSQPEDAKYLRKVIEKHIESILSVNWDMRLLQEHLHKLRREIRKLALLKAAARGKIGTLEEEAIPESLKTFQELPPEAERYLKLEESPFMLKHRLYYYKAAERTLAYATDKFGVFKDWGELYDLSMKMLVDSGSFGWNRKAAESAADAWLRPRLAEKFGWKHYLEEATFEYNRLFVRDPFLSHLLAPKSATKELE